MTFIIRQIAIKSDGGEIVRESSAPGASVEIGRNADNAVHLPDLAVNPLHARVTRQSDGTLSIESVSGQPFEADGRSGSSARIDPARGGELRFGGHLIGVSQDDSGNPVFTVRRVEALSDSAEDKDEGFIYSLKGLLPGKRISAWGFAVLVLLAALAFPLWSWASYQSLAYNEDAKRPAGFHPDTLWSSGKLSLAHETLSNDCQACHVDAFVSVRDNACLTCHTDDAHEHAPIDKQIVARGKPVGFAAFQRAVAATFNKPQGRCVECHSEHEGAGAMQVTAQRFCAECHDGMDTRLTGTKLENAADFGRSHPQFRPAVLVAPVLGPDDKAKRRRVSIIPGMTENNGLKFPHDLHLNETGGVAQMGRRLSARFGFGASLVCEDCHKTDPNGVRYEPVDMEENCGMCHSLAFDKVGNTFRTLRHGEPDMVRADLTAYYRGTGPRRPLNLGSLPRQRPGLVNSRRTAQEYANAVRFRGGRADQAIRAVFSRGGACYDCHTVIPPKSPGSLDFEIGAVTQTGRYLHKGWFDHSAHDKEDCSDCHAAKTSDKASDLLIPGIDTCRECHTGEKGDSLVKVAKSKEVKSTCAMCHDYHADKGAPWLIREEKKEKRGKPGDQVAAR